MTQKTRRLRGRKRETNVQKYVTIPSCGVKEAKNFFLPFVNCKLSLLILLTIITIAG